MHIKVGMAVEGHNCSESPGDCTEGSVTCAIWKACMGKVKDDMASRFEAANRTTERAYLIATLRELYTAAIHSNDLRLALDTVSKLADVMKSKNDAT